jgi:hypothetical protein
MAVAVVALITLGARWLLHTGQDHGPLPTPPSGLLPPALADEMKRKAHAHYRLGLADAVEFWRLTGIVPDTPTLRDALSARHQVSPNPLTAPEAQAILQHVPSEALP